MFLSRLQSHPQKPLNLHLSEVANSCRKIVESKRLDFSGHLNAETLPELAYLIGATHDFGKATRYFQEYLNEKDESKKRRLKAHKETKHGLLSAIFTYYVTKNSIRKMGFSENQVYCLLPVLAFLIVKRHHGNLGNGYDEVNEMREKVSDEREKQVLCSQLDAIDEAEMEKILADVIPSSPPSFTKFKEGFLTVMKELAMESVTLARLRSDGGSIFPYFVTLFLYSVLVDSDKAEAMGLGNIERADIPPDLVDLYKQTRFGRPKKRIDEIREQIYREVNGQVQILSLDNGIFSLNVPTGAGKTLTALSFALKLRDRVKNERGYTPRIVYSLPFLSIIDQNFSEFDKALSPHFGETVPSNILLKHHHLSDIFYETEEDEFSPGRSQFLIEGWNSEITVTTFVQLFHSLISNKNRSIRKFHNIVNSIVLLDEIQSIPHEYWLLLKQTLQLLSKYFKTYFVFMTATEPLILDEATGEAKPLVENKERYFEGFNRTVLNLRITEETPIEDFEKIVLEDVGKRKDRDFLIVMNTIDSSKRVFTLLNKLNDEANEVLYLSTNIVPIERLERIKRIKDKSNGKRKIIVSTQLIEAGVDIDVDVIYRDFCPLDSINQTAGRSNRNDNAERKGEVNVYILKGNRTNKPFYKYIYDGFIMNKTKDVLKNRDKIEEREFLRLIDDYFERLKRATSTDESSRILEHLNKLEFKETGDFKLIEEDYEKVDIFVELNDEARRIWETFASIMEKDDTKKKRERLLEIKKRFYGYVISVPKGKVGSVCFENDIGHIQLSDLERKYDIKTGFIPEGGPLII